MPTSIHSFCFLFLVTCAFLLTPSCEQPKSVTVNHVNLDIAPDSVSLFAPGIVSTALVERDLAISPDKSEIIWTLGDYKQSVRCLVHITQNESGNWTDPEILPFSGVHQDIEPFISPDGDRLFFASTRPIIENDSTEDYNIWVSKKGPSGWETPAPLPPAINTPEQEFYPSVAVNGNLYFTATREEGIGREDIYRSTLENGEYQPAVPLDTGVNTAAYEFNAWISPEENLLIFSSFGRSDGFGGGDLYLSRKGTDGSWESATHLPEGINSDKLDYCPFVDMEAGILYFSSERVGEKPDTIRSIDELSAHANQLLNGMSNIYQVKFEKE